MIRSLCAIACFLAFTVACGTDPVNFSEAPMPEGTATIDEDQGIPAFLRGNLDDMEDINGFADRVYTRGNSNYTEIVATVPHEDGRKAMSIFNIQNGGLNHPDLQPGAHFVFDYLAGSPDTDVEVRVTGCLLTADTSPNTYFDDPAGSVEVWVDSLPDTDTKRVNYLATWEDEGTYTGYFDVPNN